MKNSARKGPRILESPGILCGDDVVNLERRERRGVVAHQQRACFARAEPLTLLAKGKLHIIYVEQNRAV